MIGEHRRLVMRRLWSIRRKAKYVVYFIKEQH
jgi:hypothetical protein